MHYGMDFRQKLLEAFNKNPGEWSEAERGGLISIPDLLAADAVYHNICSINFRTGREVPNIFPYNNHQKPKLMKIGKPKDQTRKEAFLSTMIHLETCDDVINKMDEFLHGSGLEPYGFTYMKNEVTNHFKGQVFISNLNRKEDIVTLRTTASAIIYKFHQTAMQNCDEDE